MKSVRDNLAVSPFSDLKDLISRNRCKTKTKPYFLWSSFLFQSMKLQKCIIQESSKEGLHLQCQTLWLDSEVTVQKTKKRKIPIVSSSNDSEKEKTAFFESDTDVIPNSEPKYKLIVYYKDLESDMNYTLTLAWISMWKMIKRMSNKKKTNPIFCLFVCLFFCFVIEQ